MNKLGGEDAAPMTAELDIPRDPNVRAIIATMSDGAHVCLRGIRSCCTDEQYQEAHERVMQIMIECYALKIRWQTICMAQGETKPCATCCLHCERVERALMPKPTDAA